MSRPKTSEKPETEEKVIRKRRTKAEMEAARSAESKKKPTKAVEEDEIDEVDETEDEEVESFGAAKRKRRTKAEMLAESKAATLAKEASAEPIVMPFKLGVFDHAELKSLKSEDTGFSVSVRENGKEVWFNFDTFKERIWVMTPVPKSGYPIKYCFTVSQFLNFITKAKAEKREDGL